MTNQTSGETFVIERMIHAPRELVWEALLEVLSAAGYAKEGDPPPHGRGSIIEFRIGDYDLVEETISFEPPWRRRYALVAGAPLASYRATIAIRDDGARCFLEWSYVANPGDHAGAKAFLDRAQQALKAAADYIASTAEVRASSSD